MKENRINIFDSGRAAKRAWLAGVFLFSAVLFTGGPGECTAYADDQGKGTELRRIEIKAEKVTKDSTFPSFGVGRTIKIDQYGRQTEVSTGAAGSDTPENMAPSPEQATATPAHKSAAAMKSNSASAPSVQSPAFQETKQSRRKPEPDPNYKGISVANDGGKKAPMIFDEPGGKAMARVENLGRKQGENAKAQSPKSLVQHSDSPQLQSLEEKKQKRKEAFRKALEERPARKALKEKTGNDKGAGE